MIRSLARQLRAWWRRRATCADGDLAALLGRPPVSLDTPGLQRFIGGRVVLVTGAGGSIGSEICRQTMRFCPRRLVLVEQAENALFEIDSELRQTWVGSAIRPYIADICDRRRIGDVLAAEKPDVVFHCAAHKHVPMMEANAGEAVKNNVLGTKNVADAAAHCGCGAFVLISTDKAVNPTSVMGATKRCAELYVQSLNSADSVSGTRFVAVRFGNVLGSSGSVVPIFRRQIAAGGPVTVTHPEMRRYFMTVSEATQLVMQAGAIGRGGEVFVLDMGTPVRILDLACEMIRRAGLRPGEDIAIRFTGVRPGEKLYEELRCDDEQTCPTCHPRIRIWRLPPVSPEQAQNMLSVLAAVVDAPRDEVIAALSRCVPEYQPDAGGADSAQRQSMRLVPAAA